MSRHSVAYLAALAMLAACDKESTVVQLDHSDVASVTIVNTTPNVVKTYVGEQLLNSATPNLQAATWFQNCAFVPPSSTTVTFKALADTNIAATGATTFAAGTRYTTFLAQSGTTASAFVLPETFVPLTQGNYGVRIVNATGQSGDFYITPTAGTLPATPTASLAANTATGGTTGVGGYITSPTSTPRVRMFATGNTTTQLASVNLDATSLTTNVTWTQGTTVVFTKNSSGTITAFTIGQCQ
jgi:hypothetical protein